MVKKTGILILIAAAALAFFGYLYVAEGKFTQDFLSRYADTNENDSVSKQPNTVSTTGAVRVPIFVYHSVLPYYPAESTYRKKFDVEPDIFEKQLRYLKENGYTVIPLDNLVNHFSRGLSLPEKSVVLTFDDGWENQYRYAFPLLKKYNATATFFIFTNAIGHRYFLTWPQIQELTTAGMTVGDHSQSHPYLYKITDPEKLRREIVGGREVLENHLGRRIDLFAYPFGRYNQTSIAILKENGFRAARTDGYQSVLHTFADLFTLKSVDAKNDLAQFVAVLNAAR